MFSMSFTKKSIPDFPLGVALAATGGGAIAGGAKFLEEVVGNGVRSHSFWELAVDALLSSRGRKEGSPDRKWGRHEILR